MGASGTGLPAGPPEAPQKRWSDAAGAWLGIGTSPGTLLLGAGIASRYSNGHSHGAIPFISLLFGFICMFALLWFQGRLGLNPPLGEGQNLTQVSKRYFSPSMQRIVAALIAMGMIGWFGFNVGLGGAALSALLRLPSWAGPLLIGIPILVLSLRGMKSWNALAAIATLAVIALVVMVVLQLGGDQPPVTFKLPGGAGVVVDVVAFVGYVSVFTVRAPDFTVGLNRRKDLVINILLLTLPILFIALAGAALHAATGSTDLVGILAGPNGMGIGNLLISLSVIAPTFTTLYSGAPALQASIGMKPQPGMIVITLTGLTLAVLRFDHKLIAWVVILAATLPPLIIPLVIESIRRRRGKSPQRLSVWLWLPGALTAMLLTFLDQPFAPLVGMLVAAGTAAAWYSLPRRIHNPAETRFQ